MDSAEKILTEARMNGEFKRAVYRLLKMQVERDEVMGSREQREVNWKTERCLVCGGGVKKKNTGVDTVFVCMTCGWFKVFNGEVMDESRRLEEAYTPGVTGKMKGMRMMAVKGGKVVGEVGR